MMFRCWFLSLVAMFTLAGSVTARAAECGSLTGTVIGDATIVRSTRIGSGEVDGLARLPAFCRVVAVSRPTPTSEIVIEVWLPDAWNGRYQQVGNGGWAGVIPLTALAAALRHGFMAAGTDDGHRGSPNEASWADGHPERLVDFGYRALHETNMLARRISERFYGRPPARAYFSGCSDGGREALMTAQRYPGDFDGWLVGAPANDWSLLSATILRAYQISAAARLGREQLRTLAAGALATCGARDGVISDPSKCAFDATMLVCHPGATTGCLTRSQADAANAIHFGARERPGSPDFPGLYGTMGTEDRPGQWQAWFGSADAIGPQIVGGYFITSFTPIRRSTFSGSTRRARR